MLFLFMWRLILCKMVSMVMFVFLVFVGAYTSKFSLVWYVCGKILFWILLSILMFWNVGCVYLLSFLIVIECLLVVMGFGFCVGIEIFLYFFGWTMRVVFGGNVLRLLFIFCLRFCKLVRILFGLFDDEGVCWFF